MTKFNKNDKRIYRPEQMSERHTQIFSERVDSFLDKHYRNKPTFEEKMEADPNKIKIDGKWYDKRYLKN